uniref:Uncharacterized protein n=1 Tax=Vitis vinifera TaxID=29760 RepID=A5BTN0_VITVI|nr:hypothetical protein VITISV_042149 [Vitis vinifera]
MIKSPAAGSLGEEKQATLAYLPSISIGGNGKSCYQKAYFTKGTSFPGNLATLRFPGNGRIGPGLRFITPKAFSELLKLSREYKMLTVTKVTDFRWTRSQRVQSNSVTSLRENLAAYLLYPRVLARLGSFFEPCFSLLPFPVLPSKTGRMEYSQVVRHRFLVPACKGSNPFTPDYEHPIGSVKNELTTTGEAADCSP